MKRTFSLLVFTCCFTFALAQSKIEGSLFFGISSYHGDLINQNNFTHYLKEVQPAFGGILRYSLSLNLAIRAQGMMSKISSSDRKGGTRYEYYDRGYSFTNSLKEFSVLGEWDFLGHKRFTENGRHIGKTNSPYLFTGVAVILNSPKVDFGQNQSRPAESQISSDKNESNLSATRMAIPFGVGYRMDLTPQFNLDFELGFRPVFSDYLDGVSKSGNPNDRDGYAFGGVALTYRFGLTDSDRDGLADRFDACPAIPGLVKLAGCPDSDKDGIADHLDDCPNLAGNTNTFGCPDADQDGTPDIYDKCPDLPGLSSMSGCPDRDGDGITDKLDHCPDVAGYTFDLGCPPADSDKDGIIDREDNCPEIFGIPKFLGCPDSDGDGLMDTKDDCPQTPGLFANAGCPEKVNLDTSYYLFSLPTIMFQTNSSQVLNETLSMYKINKTTLDLIVEMLTHKVKYNLLINGHTDNLGSEDINQRISEQRAASCYQYFVESGIDPNRLKIQGFGETQPIANNETIEGRMQNRRVEFELFLK